MSSATTVNPVAEKSAVHKISVRLVPFVALMFFINFLDRTAIGYAGPNGMQQDLGMTAAQFGLASGVFFIGYIILEVPSNLALHRFGARVWLSRIMVTWGIVAVLFTWVQSSGQLYALRVLLGVAEAGFFPGAILFLSMLVPSQHRSRTLMLFYLAQPLTSVVGAPLASWLIQQHGALGLEGWRFMYLCVGAPAVIVGVIAFFYLKDKPEDCPWLTAEEVASLRVQLDAEAAANSGEKSERNVMAALTSGRVWVLSLIYFGFIYGLYALSFFLPTIIKGFGAQFGIELSILQQGLVTAVPYAFAAIAMNVWSRDVTRRGLRSWHIGVPAAIGGVSIPVALFVGSPVIAIGVISITAMSIFAVLPNFWTLPTQFLTGAPAAAGVALINTIGNIAGFSAGYITGAIHDWTGGYVVPMFVVGGFMILSAALMVLLARRGQVRVADAA
ncbi:Inner membrane transport protein RhmT [Propionibacterium australiense]|uniref:Major facilitator superfamily domain n=2 Tax=Propionibacterium australiense TaxID=119981 RepID=A0A383S7W2_9ACTN|nr:Major facilitator superfamily domain [Propionibacterium australiense]VEH91781.1 Inner membrane transport protein RhmT [Propionibacterium australiense]